MGKLMIWMQSVSETGGIWILGLLTSNSLLVYIPSETNYPKVTIRSYSVMHIEETVQFLNGEKKESC